MSDRDKHLLLSIKDECEYISEKIENCNLDDFIDDRDLKYIVVLALIKIGGYVKSLSEDLKQTYPGIRWISITNLRNVAAHNYDGLRMDDVWRNITRDVPELLDQVEEILLRNGENINS